MKTYQEYLAENGATAEEIAVLATAKAIAAYNKIQADNVAAVEAARVTLTEEMNAKNQAWWDETYSPAITAKDADILRLTGENERNKAVLKKAQEMGLTQLAIDAGHDPAANPTNPTNPTTPTGFDPKKYVAVDDFQNAYRSTGKAIAQATAIQAEHFALFGTMPIDMEDMLETAATSGGKKNLRQVWEEKHKVADKRAAIDAQKQQAHDDKIREETTAKIRAEYGMNPDLRRPAVSNNSFTVRPSEADGKKFFERDPAAAQKARVEKYAGKIQ